MRKLDKKAFTLIELIVTIAVLGILVLLASPRFFGHTQNAELTKGFANAKSIEKASELYYMDYEDWPRLTDDPYTSEEIEAYSERIFNHTGQEVNLDTEGNYYDIDYDKLSDYIRVPDDKKNYILQNPVGKVFYMDNLNETGIARVDYSNAKEEDDNPKVELMNPIDPRNPVEGEIPIATAEELAKIGQPEYPLNGKYILTDNINLSKNGNWTPIGNSSSKFTGSFDGNGYNITGLTINMSTNYVGLFGYTEGATISNVGLIDNKVTGSSAVGGLVGGAWGTNITNSYATGSVEGTGNNVGGLVGSANSSTKVSNSYATGSVTGSGERVGGLVGSASSVTISNSYATGSVKNSDSNYTGGFVGYAYNGGTISNSYSTGSVTGSSAVGGLAGRIDTITIENSYATGSVTGSRNVGGLVGEANNVWVNGTSYSTTISNSYATGSVTGSGERVGGLVGSSAGITISNSYATGPVKNSDSNYTGGLVGFASNGSKISNSYSTGSVTGGNHVGGLVGYSISTMISNSYATGSVAGTGDKVGGLVGYSVSTMISNSYATGSVRLVGNTGDGTTISNSYRRTTDAMKQQATYSGWDFDTVWEIDEGQDYPKLR